MLQAISAPSVELGVGDRWVIDVQVLDDDGEYVGDDVTVVVTSTSPNGTDSTPTVDRLSSGVYRAIVDVSSSGRYVATATATGYGSVFFSAHVSGVTATAGMPTVDDVKEYAGDNLGSWSDDEIQTSLDSEASQQRKRCRVAAVYPPDLAEALKRRVVRALNLREKVMPTDFSTGFDTEGASFVPLIDPEIRRLEAPYRKVTLL